jgi:hypothetical protein
METPTAAVAACSRNFRREIYPAEPVADGCFFFTASLTMRLDG